MSNFPILDLVAGLIFVYFLLSIISSSAVEIVLTLSKTRAKVLEAWLRRIFSETVTIPGKDGPKEVTLAEAIMDHCSTTALSGTKASTSYIDAKNFTSALIEKISYVQANPMAVPNSLASLSASIAASTGLSDELKRVFLLYASEASSTYSALATKTMSEMDLFRSKLEAWYDSSMDRITGTLKENHSRPLTFWLGLVIVFLLNADSISLSKYLYNNPEARTKLATAAYDASKDTIFQQKVQKIDIPKEASSKDSATLQQIKDSVASELKDLKEAKNALADVIPLGWSNNEFKKYSGFPLFLAVLLKIVGLFATTLAVMMGAPFWFDILNKVSNLRGSGKKPASATDKKKKW